MEEDKTTNVMHDGMTREEYLEWCKMRARDYLVRHDYMNAVTSMLSDLSKHPELKPIANAMAPIGMNAIMSYSYRDVQRFIEGFN